MRGQIRIIEETHDTVQTNRPRIAKLSAEDTIDIVENSDPIRLWINDGHWTGNKRVESDMARFITGESDEISRHWPQSEYESPMTETAKSQAQRASYASSDYVQKLEDNDCFLDDSDAGVAEESQRLCKSLLELKQTFPEHSLFCDEDFATTCKSLQNENETEIIEAIGRLIVPRVKALAIKGAKHLSILQQSCNVGWIHSIPLLGTRPQPDYSVGFNQKAFSKLQLTKLSPFISSILEGSTERSFFKATPRMFFPFLACEVKSSTVVLETADRQNAHSMTLAVRGMMMLFHLVKRQNELNRIILAFSISHDNEMARIYGHYAVIDEDGEVRYFRHAIARIFFAQEDGQNKWKVYQFTKNIYDVWMPEHLKRIQSAIDQFPDEWAFEAPKLSYLSSAARKLQAVVERREAQAEVKQGEEVSATMPMRKRNESNCGSKRDVQAGSPVAPSSCKKQKTSVSQS